VSDLAQTVDWIARATAVVGAATGLCSLIWQFKRAKTRLKVIPGFETYGEAIGAPQTDIVIKVVNLSDFPVVIQEAGVRFRNGKMRPLKFTHTFSKEEDTDTEDLPIKLAPRESIVIASDEQDGVKAALILSSGRAKCAYVRTADGYTKTGTSKALKGRAATALSAYRVRGSER
jgi:hypothetical protein